MEPKYPGLVERYVNLGDCYDRAGLQPLRQELMGCMKGYKACYQRAYRCLTAAAQIGEDLRSLLLTPALEAKMAKRARGILSREVKKGDGEAGRAVQRFLGGVTWKGVLCQFETVDTLCKRVYELADTYGLAHSMLTHLAAGALAAGHDVIVCPSPLFPDRMEHLLIPSLSLAFVSASPSLPYPKRPYRRIRLDAMADAELLRRTPWPRPKPCTTSWRASTTPTWTSTGSTRQPRPSPTSSPPACNQKERLPRMRQPLLLFGIGLGGIKPEGRPCGAWPRA